METGVTPDELVMKLDPPHTAPSEKTPSNVEAVASAPSSSRLRPALSTCVICGAPDVASSLDSLLRHHLTHSRPELARALAQVLVGAEAKGQGQDPSPNHDGTSEVVPETPFKEAETDTSKRKEQGDEDEEEEEDLTVVILPKQDKAEDAQEEQHQQPLTLDHAEEDGGEDDDDDVGRDRLWANHTSRSASAAWADEELASVGAVDSPSTPPLRPRGRKRKHPADRPPSFECPVCSKVLASQGNLNKHLFIHSDKKKFRCTECDAGFNQKRDLDHHRMQRHTGERPHACPICGKGFVHKAYLSEHLAYHTEERKFQCSQCGKQFLSVSALNKHRGRHRTHRAFRCDLCPKAFTVKVDLKAHVKYVHEKAGRDTGIPVFPARSTGGTRTGAIPVNYVSVPAAEEEEGGGGRQSTRTGNGVGSHPVYQKPRPALRMVTPPSDGAATAPARLPGMTTRSVSAAASEAIPETERLQRQDIEAQQDIEEWMIAQGLSFGLEQQPVSVPASALFSGRLLRKSQAPPGSGSGQVVSGDVPVIRIPDAALAEQMLKEDGLVKQQPEAGGQSIKLPTIPAFITLKRDSMMLMPPGPGPTDRDLVSTESIEKDSRDALQGTSSKQQKK